MQASNLYWRRWKLLVLLTLIFFTLQVSSTFSQTKDFCRTRVVRLDALDSPSRHAWNLFVNLMHPAKNPRVARGEPDCTKPIGSPGTTSVWETWRLARTEVFLADGAEPPVWDDLSLPTGFYGSVPSEPNAKGHTVASASRTKGPAPKFDPAPNQSIFVDHGGIGETRMNRATYDFIRANCLYSNDGLRRYASAVLKGTKPEIFLPVDSMEVKPVWLEFTEEAIRTGEHKRYYHIEHEGKTYGLTSFHILTKDVPNWFWATFHHVNAPKNEYELPDRYGRPQELTGTVWENYVLGGTQIDFIEPNGKPVILSDHYIEFGFQRSSCISCHAMAHGSPNGVNGQDFDDPNGAIQTEAVGPPDIKKFLKDNAPFYIQTDFLWSIPFRARKEKNPPAKHCMF